MARTTARPAATVEETLQCDRKQCPGCGRTMWMDYANYRKVTTLNGVIDYRINVRRCPNVVCVRYHVPFRPECEGTIALPEHEFGLDVIALIGALRYAHHRSVPEIHQELKRRNVEICERTTCNLLNRYDELVALSIADNARLQRILQKQGRAILAIDGLQPDVGHEILWVVRDCLSGEVLLARSLLSARTEDLAQMLMTVKEAIGVSIDGIVSDGQHSIRRAVEQALPGVPHQLCHFHYLREAARPIYEADRHAKKELKKDVRGIRVIERRVEGVSDPVAEAVQGYCAAVRSAITDDGRAPLDAAGLKLRERLTAIEESPKRVDKKGDTESNSRG